MDTRLTPNAQIEEWMRATIIYQVAIILAIIVFSIILILWIIVEVINVKRRKLISIERQKDQMDGVKIQQKINEINNNKNKNKSQNKPLLQTVVINNMSKNYQLTQDHINRDNQQSLSKFNSDIEMTRFTKG